MGEWVGQWWDKIGIKPSQTPTEARASVWRVCNKCATGKQNTKNHRIQKHDTEGKVSAQNTLCSVKVKLISCSVLIIVLSVELFWLHNFALIIFKDSILPILSRPQIFDHYFC